MQTMSYIGHNDSSQSCNPFQMGKWMGSDKIFANESNRSQLLEEWKVAFCLVSSNTTQLALGSVPQ